MASTQAVLPERPSLEACSAQEAMRRPEGRRSDCTHHGDADQPAPACGACSARSALHRVIGEALEGDALQGGQLPSPNSPCSSSRSPNRSGASEDSRGSGPKECGADTQLRGPRSSQARACPEDTGPSSLYSRASDSRSRYVRMEGKTIMPRPHPGCPPSWGLARPCSLPATGFLGFHVLLDLRALGTSRGSSLPDPALTSHPGLLGAGPSRPLRILSADAQPEQEPRTVIDERRALLAPPVAPKLLRSPARLTPTVSPGVPCLPLTGPRPLVPPGLLGSCSLLAAEASPVSPRKQQGGAAGGSRHPGLALGHGPAAPLARAPARLPFLPRGPAASCSSRPRSWACLALQTARASRSATAAQKVTTASGDLPNPGSRPWPCLLPPGAQTWHRQA
ncbi:unnamed protein product [Rangifer tarandus platyrhynchus]|uniref:Uncharacterized protein n=1 Tax=Rangifer tarandus platyrhynchus TaxID=3082113 RepID=A0ABN8Z0J6_RANTA|nr:unnamed protein product [Rangifer tarandus platyrhynchus]